MAICHAQRSAVTVSSFRGTWQFTQVVGYADVTAGESYAHELLGTLMTISADELALSVDHSICKARQGFHVREVESAHYLREDAGASPEDAKMGARMVILDSDECPSVFYIDKNHLEFGEVGIFLKAKRIE
jgi:hypothetical protein